MEFAGRRITISSSTATLDQEKYILEEINPLPIAKGRLSRKDSRPDSSEFKALRSLVYKFHWVGRESRPEAAGVASILAGKLIKDATTGDVANANKMARHLRATASRGLTIWRLDPERMAFISFSDAGGVGSTEGLLDDRGLPADPTQGAWMILAADQSSKNSAAKASILGWRSSKLRRKVPSTLAGETQALSAAIAEVNTFKSLFEMCCSTTLTLQSAREERARLPQYCVETVLSAPESKTYMWSMQRQSLYTTL